MAELISVIVPVYNVAPYLEECFASLLVQTYAPFEVVVVEDGSTDGSREMVQEFARRDERVRVVEHARNRGLAAARNTGIEAACGELFAFIDSDDYVAPDYLERLHKNLVAHAVDISACGYCLVYDMGCDPQLVYRHKMRAFAYERLNNITALRAANCGRSFCAAVWAKLIKRELFDGIVFPEGKLCEDAFVRHQLLYGADAVYFDPEPLYFYRQRPGSIMQGTGVDWLPIETCAAQYEFIRERCPELLGVAITACALARLAVANRYAQRGDALSRLERTGMRRYVARNLGPVLTNRDIDVVRKMQVLCYALSPALYGWLYVRVLKARSSQYQLDAWHSGEHKTTSQLS